MYNVFIFLQFRTIANTLDTTSKSVSGLSTPRSYLITQDT